MTHGINGGPKNDLDCPVRPSIEVAVYGQPAIQAVLLEADVSLGLEDFGTSQASHCTVTIYGCFNRCSTLSP